MKKIAPIILASTCFASNSIAPNANILSIGVGAGIEPTAKWVVYLTPTKVTQISFSGLRDFGKNDFNGLYNLILKAGWFDLEKFYNPYVGFGYGLHNQLAFSEGDENHSFNYSSWKVGVGSNFAFGKNRRFGINGGLYYSFAVPKDAVDSIAWSHYGHSQFAGQVIPSISLTFNCLRIKDGNISF
jgi:hypothetical protein